MQQQQQLQRLQLLHQQKQQQSGFLSRVKCSMPNCSFCPIPRTTSTTTTATVSRVQLATSTFVTVAAKNRSCNLSRYCCHCHFIVTTITTKYKDNPQQRHHHHHQQQHQHSFEIFNCLHQNQCNQQQTTHRNRATGGSNHYFVSCFTI